MSNQTKILELFKWDDTDGSWFYTGSKLHHMKQLIKRRGGVSYEGYTYLHWLVEIRSEVGGDPKAISLFGASEVSIEEAWRFAIGAFFLP